MCTFLLQNVVLWDICLMHGGICEMGLLREPISLKNCVAQNFVAINLNENVCFNDLG